MSIEILKNSSSDMAATQDNMMCAVCMEVYRSPRFLPCHHTFCLPCLEELAKRHGDTIPCPTCRAPATVPPGGVCDLQVNFYFTEEALKEIQVRYDVIVAMAAKYRDEALTELETTCDDVEKGLSADTQRVQDELNSLLQLQDRAQRALSSACDMEVLQVEREMRCREISDTLPVLSDQTYLPVLHGDFYNYIEDHYMKTFIGSPVQQSFLSNKTADIDRVYRCGDGGCREVHAVRQIDDRRINVYYGGTGGDYSKETGVNFRSGRCRATTHYGNRISCVTRKPKIWEWKYPTFCHLGSKNNSMHSLMQNFATGVSYICSMTWEQKDGKENCNAGPTLCHPKVNRADNFDLNERETYFAVVDEEEEKNSDNESMKTYNNKADSRRSRVVRLYSIKCNDPIATYTSPIQPFFPTDVCFYGNDVLLIADWMNDCVHVTRVSDSGITFDSYLPGSGDMVRPTALNLDLNSQLLIGCGDGWVLRVPVNY